MTFDEYQTEAYLTSFYPSSVDVIYPLIGLTSEIGELNGKIKKLMRDKDVTIQNMTLGDLEVNDLHAIRLELGDILWYLAVLASDLGVSFESIAQANINKLKSRALAGTLKGSGDNR